MRHRFPFICAAAFAGLVLVASFPGGALAGFQSSTASCTGEQQVTFSWDWYEFDGYITARPEWVGWDVLRRPAGTCAPFERLNAQIFPRVVGQAHSHTYVDTPPEAAQTYEYQAIPVDANRERLIMLMPDCEPPCVKPAWASCPAFSDPIVVGTLQDWGWALAIQPCPGSCYFGFYFGENEDLVQELRDQGRVGTVVKLFGPGWCCGLEGGAMEVVAWEPGHCGITPARRTSWGELKTIYR